MSFETEWSEGTFVVPERTIRVCEFSITGRVNSNEASELGAILDAFVDDKVYFLVLEMSGVEYLSSAGLREIVRVLKRAKRNGGNIKISNPSDVVKENLELAGLDQVFVAYNSYDDAVEAFKKEILNPHSNLT